MIIADTDVLIDFLHGKGSVADQIALELGRSFAQEVATSFP